MKILISAHSLDYSGVPIYTLTLYRELVKRGHVVAVYSPHSGPLSRLMNVYTNFDGMETPDVILAQANKCAIWMKSAFPTVPMIFISHGVLPALEQPPRIPIDGYIAVNEQAADNMAGQYVPRDKIHVIRDFIDTELFKPVNELRDIPHVLHISNYKKWKTYKIIEAACKNLKLDFRAIGSPYGKSTDMQVDINQFDIVVGKGRCLLEAMSCGRAALSFNEELGDGYITKEMYMESRTRNFGGFQCRHAFTVQSMMRELAKYKKEDGATNRDLILKHHKLETEVDKILEVVQIYAK